MLSSRIRRPSLVLLVLGLVLTLVSVSSVLGATIRGTSRADTLRGTQSADRLIGLGGNDKLYGLGGNDFLDGGPASDVLNGGGGNDRLIARDGLPDVLVCGPGRDSARVDASDKISGCEEVSRPPVTPPPPTTPPPTTPPPTTPPPPTPPPSNCDPSYPTVCIPSPPPDLDCGDIPYRNFKVIPPDPHRFDGNKDGVGCES